MNHRLKKKVGPDRLQTMKQYSFSLAAHILFILITPILLFSVAQGDDFNSPSSLYEPLIDRLSQDGFDAEYLSKLLTDPRAASIPAVMTLSLQSGEHPDRYTQFLNPELIHLSKKFLKQNLKILKKAESRFHVEKEVIVSILLVESRFGENIGRHRVIPTLATMALIDSPENLQKNYVNLQETDPEVTYERISDLAKKKARWAYYELKCFLDIIRQEQIDPLEVYGSKAGALGMAQFIPSSYLAYAMNNNRFEDWLLGKEEAILSINNYLKSHGWKKNLSIKKKKQVLWCYNRSKPYGETILQVAQKIKQQ